MNEKTKAMINRIINRQIEDRNKLKTILRLDKKHGIYNDNGLFLGDAIVSINTAIEELGEIK